MIKNCKTGADSCPMDLNICCHECSFANTTCKNSCEENPCECGSLVEVPGEMTGFSGAVPQTINAIISLLRAEKELAAKKNELKEKLEAAMTVYGVDKWENEYISFTRVAPTTKTSIDSTKLKKLYPEAAAECTKVSPVKGYVKVVLK